MAGLKWSWDVVKRWFPNLSCHLANLATALKIITAHKIWKIGVDSQLNEGTIQEVYYEFASVFFVSPNDLVESIGDGAQLDVIRLSLKIFSSVSMISVV